MLYKFFRPIVRFIVWILNGHLHIHHKERIPDGTYILVAPHRTWWEPILFALGASPDEFMFMAKQELFKNPVLRWILDNSHAFPVNREHPGPSVLKIPIKGLKSQNLSLIMFPSGTRHSSELKNGALVIARMSGKPLVPVVYQGPLSFKDLLKRKNLDVNFGDPIFINKKPRLTPDIELKYNQELEKAWKELDNELNPSFHYEAK